MMETSLKEEVIYLINEILSMGLDRDVTLWKVSSRWVNRSFNCTLEGIKTICGGKCCHSQSYYPPRAGKHGMCDFLDLETGCLFSMEDKPIICMIYPFILNENNTLVIHHRSMNLHCKGNYGSGPRFMESLRGGLETTFGKIIVDYLMEATELGIDPIFEVDRNILETVKREEKWAELSVNPEPRTSFPVIDNPKDGISRIVDRLMVVRSVEDLVGVSSFIEELYQEKELTVGLRFYLVYRIDHILSVIS